MTLLRCAGLARRYGTGSLARPASNRQSRSQPLAGSCPLLGGPAAKDPRCRGWPLEEAKALRALVASGCTRRVANLTLDLRQLSGESRGSPGVDGHISVPATITARCRPSPST